MHKIWVTSFNTHVHYRIEIFLEEIAAVSKSHKSWVGLDSTYKAVSQKHFRSINCHYFHVDQDVKRKLLFRSWVICLCHSSKFLCVFTWRRLLAQGHHPKFSLFNWLDQFPQHYHAWKFHGRDRQEQLWVSSNAARHYKHRLKMMVHHATSRVYRGVSVETQDEWRTTLILTT